MINYLGSKLKNILKYIKTASDSAVLRLFNSRKKHYTDLLASMRSFEDAVLSASYEDGIDVGGGKLPSSLKDGKVRGKKTDAVRFKDGHALDIIDFHVPKSKLAIAKSIKEFAQAEEAIEELDSMITRFAYMETKATKKYVKEMAAFRKALAAEREKLLDTIEEMTDKHTPSQMTKLAAELTTFVNAQLPADSYSEAGWDMYISSHNAMVAKKSADAPVEFTYYMYIEDLSNEEFKTDTLILVLTGIVDTLKAKGSEASQYVMTFHLTALPKFLSPGSFKPGKRLSGSTFKAVVADMKREGIKLIGLQSVMPHLGRRKLRVTQQQLRNTGLLDVVGVEDVDVEGSEIVVYISSMQKEVIEKELWPEIIVLVRKAIRAPRKTAFVYSVEDDGAGKILRIANVNNAADI